jgi:hypothetical protein
MAVSVEPELADHGEPEDLETNTAVLKDRTDWFVWYNVDPSKKGE